MYNWFADYVMKKPGVSSYFKGEWNWQRYFVGDKLFADAGLMGENGETRFLTLRCDEADQEMLRHQYGSVAPGFYTNKRLYLTIWFDLEAVPERDRTPGAPAGFPPEETVRALVDRAYGIALSKLPKGRQKELKEE